MDDQEKLAMEIATAAHAGQFRRDGITPYIEHPKAAAARCTTPEAKAAAWLHDVLEDTILTADDLIRSGVDITVVWAVEMLTKRPNQSYDDYIAKIAESPLASEVKLADMLANLADKPTDRQREKYAKAIEKLGLL